MKVYTTFILSASITRGVTSPNSLAPLQRVGIPPHPTYFLQQFTAQGLVADGGWQQPWKHLERLLYAPSCMHRGNVLELRRRVCLGWASWWNASRAIVVQGGSQEKSVLRPQNEATVCSITAGILAKMNKNHWHTCKQARVLLGMVNQEAFKSCESNQRSATVCGAG